MDGDGTGDTLLTDFDAMKGVMPTRLTGNLPFFWLLFRRGAFTEQETDWDGGRIKLSFLDLLLRQSQQYAKELGESLKRRVFEDVFPHLAQGFITYIRTQTGGQAEFGEAQLASIF